MSAVANAMRLDADKRAREVLTPEGLSLPMTIASRGARAGALLLDLLFIFLGFFVLIMILAFAGLSLFTLEMGEATGPMEAVGVLFILLIFLSRYGYFLWFELGPRAATPGKRLLGIRVAARPVDGRTATRLTPAMVIARNLVRDVEVFIPSFFLIGGGEQAGVAGWAAFVWLAVFVLFPFFNRDNLRAGDLVAGTWVVEASHAKLKDAMSVAAPDRSSEYRFGAAELAVYGEHELQVLESVLRHGDDNAMSEVAQAISRKIGWQYGGADDREFLESFYAALRAHLEGGMRFGKRKADKYS